MSALEKTKTKNPNKETKLRNRVYKIMNKCRVDSGENVKLTHVSMGEPYGRFVIKDSSIDWNDSIFIKLDEVELVNGDNQIKLVGVVSLDFKDITKFYSYFQIRRNHRFNIKNIRIDFAYDLNQEKITLDNLKIDKKEIKNINNFLEYFNTQNRNIFNKVTFRNFVKDFFSNYEG